MTAYTFVAVRADGVRVRGRIEADDERAAAATVSRRGLMPVAVAAAPVSGPPWWRRAPARDQAVMFRSLASMLESGVPLQQAMPILARHSRGPLRDVMEVATTRVREGSSLGAALAAEGHPFTAVTLGLVRAGERGTGLAGALARAAEHLEREAEQRARLRAALAYPLVLAAIGAASLTVILTTVVPRFARLLGDGLETLPFATRMLFDASRLLRDYGAAAGLALLALTLALALRIRVRRPAWHSLALRMPVLGQLRHALAGARASHTLAALLATGAPVLAALDAAADTVADDAVQQRLRSARSRVAEGSSLAAALREVAALPPATLDLVGVGENGGRMVELLSHAAVMDERDALGRIQAGLTLLEPALVLALAAAVAFVAAALLQAVYSLRPL